MEWRKEKQYIGNTLANSVGLLTTPAAVPDDNNLRAVSVRCRLKNFFFLFQGLSAKGRVWLKEADGKTLLTA